MIKKLLFPVFAIVFLIPTILLLLKIIPATDTVLAVYVCSMITFYFGMIYTVIFQFESRGNLDVLLSLPLFALASVVFITGFAVAWHVFNLFDASDPKLLGEAHRITTTDAFYFSTTVFTTLGFGDFLPKPGVGRMLCSIEALFGSIHTAIYFSVLMVRIKFKDN